jgi:hypothetical protein
MKSRPPPWVIESPEMKAFSDKLDAVTESLARDIFAFAKPFVPLAEAVARRIDDYDRRQFRRYKVKIGDWQGLVLAKANAALRRLAKDAPGLAIPTELETLTQEQWREIARMYDARWQQKMNRHAREWQEAFAHGRPTVQLSPQEAEAFANRKVSKEQKSRQMAGGDKLKARRLRYRACKPGAHKKVER